MLFIFFYLHMLKTMCPFGRNMELLNAELRKSKPRVEVMKDLMHRTFPSRWSLYVNNNEHSTLRDYLAVFLSPAVDSSSKTVCVDDGTPLVESLGCTRRGLIIFIIQGTAIQLVGVTRPAGDPYLPS